MRFTPFRRPLLLALSLLLLSGSPALADNKQAARDAYRDGSKYYDLADYAQALEAFKRAYFNYEDPTFLFNIAQCQRQLGHKKDALLFYKTFLRKSPDAPNAGEVNRIVNALERSINEEQRANTQPPMETIRPSGSGLPSDTPETSAPPEVKPAAEPGSSNTLTAKAPAAQEPIYKKWWLWAAVGGVVAVGLGVGLGVGLSGSSKEPTVAPVHFP